MCNKRILLNIQNIKMEATNLKKKSVYLYAVYYTLGLHSTVARNKPFPIYGCIYSFIDKYIGDINFNLKNIQSYKTQQ